MKSSILTTAVLGAALTASSSFAQDDRQTTPMPMPTPAPMPCPNPTQQTIQMTSAVVINSEFSAAALALPRAAINDSRSNRVFLHTFRWDPPRCCQITGATLTVVVRANQPGFSPPTSPDAGNDTIAIWGGGAPIPGMGGNIYTSAVNTNQQITKTIVINAAGLAAKSANSLISYSGQDDSAVTSASLSIVRCCVNMR